MFDNIDGAIKYFNNKSAGFNIDLYFHQDEDKRANLKEKQSFVNFAKSLAEREKGVVVRFTPCISKS